MIWWYDEYVHRYQCIVALHGLYTAIQGVRDQGRDYALVYDNVTLNMPTASTWSSHSTSIMSVGQDTRAACSSILHMQCSVTCMLLSKDAILLLVWSGIVYSTSTNSIPPLYRGMLITIAMLCVLIIRASMHTMMVSRYFSSVYLSYVLSICMLIGCIADTDRHQCIVALHGLYTAIQGVRDQGRDYALVYDNVTLNMTSIP